MNYAKDMLEKLASILSTISQNLTNPHYIHYLFESLVAFVRISSSNQQLCADIENYLLPCMQEVAFLHGIQHSISIETSSNSCRTSSSCMV